MNNYYGRGVGKIWLDYVHCTGSEESLVYCSHAGWGVIHRDYRTHSHDVSIYCRPGLFSASSIHENTSLFSSPSMLVLLMFFSPLGRMGYMYVTQLSIVV